MDGQLRRPLLHTFKKTIVILLTHAYFLEEDAKEKEIMRPYVPLGILYISAYLEERGTEHKVYDTTFSTYQQFCNYLLEQQPKLIGIYTNLMTKLAVLKTIRFIRSQERLKNCKIILGGPEIRYNAKNYLLNGADVLVVGEGEQSFFELSEGFSKSGNLLTDIPGLAFMREGSVCYTAERTLIKDLNLLPMPARKNIDLSLYGNAWKKHHGYSMYSVSTMRGCPYTCKWCSRAVYGGTYRRRSPKLVVDELNYLKEQYSPDRIWFVDDVFTISHKWLKEFRDEVVNRNVWIPYEIITRADRMNPEVIRLLKESGCFRVWIGAESGSQRIIDAMDRRVEVSQVREMIIKTKEAGIEAGTFIMLGYPGERREDIEDTIQHLKLSNPSLYTITIAYPITGTPLYNEVESTLSSNTDWTENTDRDYDFKRTQKKAYYQHAIRWVNNEVSYYRSKNAMEKLKFKSKSIVSQGLMRLYRN